MKTDKRGHRLVMFLVLAISPAAIAQQPAEKETSYLPVAVKEHTQSVQERMQGAKPEVMKRQMDLLQARYDLSNRPAAGATMSRGKPVQEGVRAKLKEGMSWDKLGAMTPEEIKENDLFAPGFMPLSHPNHPEGGMVFPKFHIDEIKKQEDRDLTRDDLDFDLPDHFLPEFPPALYLTTRPDLGDVSQGKLITLANYFAIFNGLLNPKQLEGMRLLVTPFPQQQFNSTDDRRTVLASRGVTCFDCHANGHTNGGTHPRRMCGRRPFGTGSKLRHCVG